MNYQNETVEELERILDMMIADKNRLISNGFHSVADQNQQVINAITSELRKRA
jgi:16S rRNA A1518/A1519 N6-dimethyltransferase RsmA/KsgA/DIM1 with predicted DNA glycosylase/AP lyase activity